MTSHEFPSMRSRGGVVVEFLHLIYNTIGQRVGTLARAHNPIASNL